MLALLSFLDRECKVRNVFFLQTECVRYVAPYMEHFSRITSAESRAHSGVLTCGEGKGLETNITIQIGK